MAYTLQDYLKDMEAEGFLPRDDEDDDDYLPDISKTNFLGRGHALNCEIHENGLCTCSIQWEGYEVVDSCLIG